MPKLLTAATAAAALAASSPALAQQQPTTRAELARTVDSSFDQGDTNNDGFINRDEMQSVGAKALQKVQEQVQAKAAEQFAKIDADRNGQISLAEFKAAMNVRVNETPEQAVAKFDSNKDGRISAAEFRAPVLAAFDRADKNKDGRLSTDEAAAARQR